MTQAVSTDRKITAAALGKAFALSSDMPDRFTALLEQLRQRQNQDNRSVAD